MNNKLVPSGQNPQEVKVDLGDGHVVSMQTVQHIYNEITGQTEELERNFQINHCVNFQDLKQLNNKIEQLYEQYNIVSSNCSVTLYHVDDQKQVFSSFSRFKIYDPSSLSPVENIEIKYRFLIILPQVQKPQSYEISIGLRSRAAVYKRAEKEDNFHGEFFVRFIARNTANLQIKYIDYTVARNFQHVIDEWLGGLASEKYPRYMRTIQKYSHHIPFFAKLISVLGFVWACASHFSGIHWAGKGIEEIYFAGLYSFSGIFILSSAINKLSSILTSALNGLQPVSYINLTRGDEIAFGELKNSNKKSWIRVMFSLVMAIAINVFSSWLAFKMGVGGT